MKIYIAGPMSGLVEFNRPAFMFTAAKLTGRGHTALNPAILPDGLSQAEYMDICLQCCDALKLFTCLKAGSHQLAQEQKKRWLKSWNCRSSTRKRIEQHDANQTNHKVANAAFLFYCVHLQPN